MDGYAGRQNQVYPSLTETGDFDPQSKKNSFGSGEQSKTYDDSREEQRRPTDVFFFTVFAAFLALLSSFIIYCMVNGDIYRVINGYDNCGTVCKATLKEDEAIKGCYNITNHTLDSHFGRLHVLYYNEESKVYDRICTDNCSYYKGYKQIFNRCIQPINEMQSQTMETLKNNLQDFFFQATEDFQVYCNIFLYMCLLSLVISLGFLLLLPVLAGALVFLILAGVVIASVGATIMLWMFWKEKKDLQHRDPEFNQGTWCYLCIAILATFVTAIVIIVILVMIKRIKLVVQLFEEAGKAISAMPGLLFEPLLTFVSLLLTIALWFGFCIGISGAGYLTEKRANVYYYKKDGIMEATKYLNFFGMWWMVQFVAGCQHMVIAGAVSKWYFTRDKKTLSSPVVKSFYNLTRYHLGTVAVGSLLLTTVQILKWIVTATQSMMKKDQNSFVTFLAKWCLCVCNCCLWVMEHVLQVLSRNAYIISAMHGHSFWKSGKQAFKHLALNPLRVAAINSVGDFILFLFKVMVVACSVALGAYFLKNIDGIQHLWVPLVLIGLFSYFISHCFMTVYEMTIDTIFICFCEDCEQNDGISNEYYMSRGLMDFVENSKKALEIREQKDEARRHRKSDADEARGHGNYYRASNEMQTVSLSVT